MTPADHDRVARKAKAFGGGGGSADPLLQPSDLKLLSDALLPRASPMQQLAEVDALENPELAAFAEAIAAQQAAMGALALAQAQGPDGRGAGAGSTLGRGMSRVGNGSVRFSRHGSVRAEGSVSAFAVAARQSMSLRGSVRAFGLRQGATPNRAPRDSARESRCEFVAKSPEAVKHRIMSLGFPFGLPFSPADLFTPTVLLA